MKTTDILTEGCVCVPLVAREKVAVITELVDALDREGLLTNRDQVLSAVLAREKIRSTATEQGLAVPHGKSPGVPKLVMAVGKPDTPIDFGGPEGYPPSELVILLASAVDETGPHIQALAKVSRVWLNQGFRSAIRCASTSGAVVAAFDKFDG
jgi:mannitol/fructose-specific phosphotransferase system IIA component (Ntr-type)